MRIPRPFFGLLLAVVALGQAPGQEDPPLTPSQVDNFLAAFTELEAWARQHEDDYEDLMPSGGDQAADADAAPLAAAVAAMRGHEAVEEMLGILKKNGFEDVDAWARAGNRILRAYAAVKMEAEQPRMEAGMREALRQIQESDMPAEQKEAMKQMMQSSRQMMAGYMEVPQADKEIARQRMEALEREFGGEDNE